MISILDSNGQIAPLVPKSTFVGMPLRQLVSLIVDGEDSEDPSIREYYETTLAESLREVTREKVDNYVAVIDMFTEEIAAIARRIEVIEAGAVSRLYARNERAQKELNRLKDRALEAIRISGDRKLEGNTATLKASGVPASCEVYDESRIPTEFRLTSVKWSGSLSEWVERIKASYGQTLPPPGPDAQWALLPIKQPDVEYSIDKRALLKALKSDCPNCNGEGVVCRTGEWDCDTCDPEQDKPCPVCNGCKTRQIPGARLIENRFRLVVE